MTDSDRKQRIVSTFRICWIGLLYVLVASAVMHAYMEKHAFNQDKERIGLELMLSQQAHKPFVLRVLSPLIVKTVSDLIPALPGTADVPALELCFVNTCKIAGPPPPPVGLPFWHGLCKFSS